jgi:hypothetical protein
MQSLGFKFRESKGVKGSKSKAYAMGEIYGAYQDNIWQMLVE